MRNLEYKDLEVFAVVAEAGSIRAAAQRLTLSQPSVSQRLTRLERGLGVTLLVRSTQGVEMTPTGRLILPYIERGKDLLDELFAALDRSTPAQTLAVWADATLAPVVMPFVCSTLEGLPIELSNRVASSEKVLLALEHGAADVGFAPPAEVPDSIDSLPFFRDGWTAVVHPRHELAGVTDAEIGDLVAHDLAVAEWSEASTQLARRLASLGVPPERLRMVSPASTVGMLSLRCGYVGISTRSSLVSAVREDVLVEVPVRGLADPGSEVHMMFRGADARRSGLRELAVAVSAAWDEGGPPGCRDPFLDTLTCSRS